jgi:hypothetical protein
MMATVTVRISAAAHEKPRQLAMKQGESGKSEKTCLLLSADSLNPHRRSQVL